MDGNIRSEECIDFYYGEYKTGIFGKRNNVRLEIYPSTIAGIGFTLYESEFGGSAISFEISMDNFIRVYGDKIGKDQALCIEYSSNSVVNSGKSLITIPGIQDMNKWVAIIETAKEKFDSEKDRKEKIRIEQQEAQNQLAIEREQAAEKFYQDCYSFHIKESTPTYQLFCEKNKVALIYIGDGKSLNFLKIDGYVQEENNGIIAYDNIHYFDKAGNISYVTDIHGSYSSYGGSMNGGNFSKLATVGGGLLFGVMGMAMGAALTYEPAQQEAIETTFSIDSDIKKIDDRSVILNFYSDMKKQYVDIELPQDIYNFLQTYYPEKKYSTVDELERKTIFQQSSDVVGGESLLKSNVTSEKALIEKKEALSIDEFREKVEKLKLMKEAGLLSTDQFEVEQAKLLEML